MKTFVFSTLASLLLMTSQAQAERLLRCNTPMGSSLQEVEITSENGVILLNELNMSGSRSAPRVISEKAWFAQDIKWQSRNDGSIRLKLVNEQGSLYWFYTATSLGSKVIGYCDPT